LPELVRLYHDALHALPFPARMERARMESWESGQNRSLPLPPRKNPKPGRGLRLLANSSELATGTLGEWGVWAGDEVQHGNRF
jgi:hypothetical protein